MTRPTWWKLAAAFVAGATVSAVITAVVIDGTRASTRLVGTAGSGSTSAASTTPSTAASTNPSTNPSTAGRPAVTLPSTPTTTSLTTAGSATASTTVARSQTSTGQAGTLTGRVTDDSGHPVPGAYVIGLDTLTVVRTDSAGRWSMPCQVSSGGIVGTRSEPLVAGTWLLPVQPTGQGSYSHGGNTTDYGFPPTTPGGLGYAFSGGAADATHAAAASCNGHTWDFTLPPGGAADIHFLHPPDTSTGPPVDNLYLPGLGPHASLETQPLTADGHQVLTEMGPGQLFLDVLYPMHCTGPDLGSGNQLTITPGRTSYVTCS